MGCDIHMHRERKLPDGTWESMDEWEKNPDYDSQYDSPEDEHRMCIKNWKSLHIGRDYALFGFLSKGVRWDCECAFAQRGLPDDVTPNVKDYYDYEDCDAHSTSYLNVKEIKDSLNLVKLTLLHDSPRLVDAVNSMLDHLFTEDEMNENHRIVFWFDN